MIWIQVCAFHDGLVCTFHKMIWNLAHPHTENACKISDLENRSAHAQMDWSQQFGKSEISLDTGTWIKA